MDPTTALVLRTALLQGVSVDVDLDPIVGLGSSAVGSFLTTLLVGAILLALAPEYTERMTETVLDDLGGAFVYGVAALVFLVLATIVLVVTIVGIVVAIPLFFASVLVWAVGASIAFLAIGRRLVDRPDEPLVALLVGAAINGGLVLTGVGGIVSFCVGAVGFGAILRDWTG